MYNTITEIDIEGLTSIRSRRDGQLLQFLYTFSNGVDVSVTRSKLSDEWEEYGLFEIMSPHLEYDCTKSNLTAQELNEELTLAKEYKGE